MTMEEEILTTTLCERAELTSAAPEERAVLTPAPAPPGAAPPGAARPSRRRFLRTLVGGAALVAGSSTYARMFEPFWVEYHDVPLPVQNLPKAFEGYRIVQLTDLHSGKRVPLDFLQTVIDRVNAIAPDLVIVTGDLVTDSLEWVNPVCDLLGKLKAPVYVTLGNHDYHEDSLMLRGPAVIADAIEGRLATHRIPLLKNRAAAIERNGQRLWLLGMEDLFSGRFSPQMAYADLALQMKNTGASSDEPVFCLSHNPDTSLILDTYAPQWIFSGHTHGGQVRLPGFGAIFLNVQNPKFEQGFVKLGNSNLYVSRGVGYLAPIRIFCRPEVPCFVLQGTK